MRVVATPGKPGLQQLRPPPQAPGLRTQSDRLAPHDRSRPVPPSPRSLSSMSPLTHANSHDTRTRWSPSSLFAVVAAGTPGPSNLLLTATGASVGVVRGLALPVRRRRRHGGDDVRGGVRAGQCRGRESQGLARAQLGRGRFSVVAGLEDRDVGDGVKRGRGASRSACSAPPRSSGSTRSPGWSAPARRAPTSTPGSGSALPQALTFGALFILVVAAVLLRVARVRGHRAAAASDRSAPGGGSISRWARSWPDPWP